VSRHLTQADFRDDEEKWIFLRDAPQIDAQEPAVKRVAWLLFDVARGNVERFCKLAMAFCRDVIRYESDTVRTGGEDIQPKGELSDILDRGTDDCDGKARLFVALCLAVGIDARMVDHWHADASVPNGRDLYHVSAEVRIPGRAAAMPVELTLYRARLGDNPSDFPLSVPKETAGHWDRNEVEGGAGTPRGPWALFFKKG
jgi:transglutaminase-like putative cysteine protease